MKGKRFLHSIQIKNLLSYGSEGVELELEPLNVLIGSNASGKSNLIEAISLLAAAPRDLLKPIREGGGVLEWLWKGSEGIPTATLDTFLVSQYPDSRFAHLLSFTAEGARLRIVDELIAPHYGSLLPFSPDFYIYSFKRAELSFEQSVFSQLKGEAYPEITYIGSHFERFAFFRDLGLGRATVLRRPQD